MRKRILIIGGVVVLVVLLAGAAFVGGRLLTGQGLPVQASSGGLQMALGGPGGKNQRFQLDEQPAKELPQTQADVRGVFDHRKDNSIFVGTGKVMFSAQKDQSGQIQTSSSHDGPTVEVVVTPQTVVYKDVTMEQYSGQSPPNGKVQQAVEPGTADDIGSSSMITAWGKKTGGRVVADVLVYTLPPVRNTRP